MMQFNMMQAGQISDGDGSTMEWVNGFHCGSSFVLAYTYKKTLIT